MAPSRNTLLRLLVAFAATFGIGYLPYMLSPLVIGALVGKLGLDEAQAGRIATAELLMFAFSQILLAPYIARLSRKNLAGLGGGIALLGHLLAAASGSYLAVLGSRLIAGLGEGIAVAAGLALIASAAAPQRMFAGAFTLGQLQAAGFLTLLPDAVQRWGHSGGYGLLALWATLMVVLILVLPGDEAAAPPESGPVRPARLRVFLAPSVLTMALVGASDGAIWTFTERIAESIGMDAQTTGVVLSVALVAGVVGSALSGVVGQRLGTTTPIVTGMLVWAACCYSITHASGSASYASAQIVYLFSFAFVVPFLYGLNGEIDPTGRTMVAASGCYLIGMALAPGASGSVIVASGFATLGWIVFVTLVVATILFSNVAWRRDTLPTQSR